jgi:hypothetical protein
LSSNAKYQARDVAQDGLEELREITARGRHERQPLGLGMLSSYLDDLRLRAMRHSSPETKRHYQLGMVDQVREGIEQANERTYKGQEKVLRIIRVRPLLR